MVRIEKDDDTRRILEALLNELSARKLLEPSTIQDIVMKVERMSPHLMLRFLNFMWSEYSDNPQANKLLGSP